VIVMGAAAAQGPATPIRSVTATVVSRSDCPVLIVPAGRQIDHSRPGLFTRLLCAVDSAPSSVSVISQALSLAWETHGHVTCVCVMTDRDASPTQIEQQLLQAIPPEANSWCDIEVVVTSGVPATELVRVAENADVDVMAIGPPQKWKSTTEAILVKSLCPVLVTHDARPLPYPPANRTGTTAAGSDAPAY
jgi:nucleotide-binding universal stress UspA family protein